MYREGNSLGVIDDKVLRNIFGHKERVRKNNFPLNSCKNNGVKLLITILFVVP
jgi:hypothetical protein